MPYNFILLLQGKISREEVARICIAALESPYACDKTFEVVARVLYTALQHIYLHFHFLIKLLLRFKG